MSSAKFRPILHETKFRATPYGDKDNRMEYGYQEGAGWGFFHSDLPDGRQRSHVGAWYPSKETLLADMHRYCTEWGFTL